MTQAFTVRYFDYVINIQIHGLKLSDECVHENYKKKKKKNEAKLGEKRNTLLEFQNNKDSSLIPVEVLLEPYRSS